MDRDNEEERFGIPQRHTEKGTEQDTSLNVPLHSIRDMKKHLVENDGGNGDGDELEDPQEKLKGTCRENEKCQKMFELLEECNDRVNSREKTTETCEQELYDFVGCVDKCVSKDLFNFLK